MFRSPDMVPGHLSFSVVGTSTFKMLEVAGRPNVILRFALQKISNELLFSSSHTFLLIFFLILGRVEGSYFFPPDDDMSEVDME